MPRKGIVYKIVDGLFDALMRDRCDDWIIYVYVVDVQVWICISVTFDFCGNVQITKETLPKFLRKLKGQGFLSKLAWNTKFWKQNVWNFPKSEVSNIEIHKSTFTLVRGVWCELECCRDPVRESWPWDSGETSYHNHSSVTLAKWVSSFSSDVSNSKFRIEGDFL